MATDWSMRAALLVALGAALGGVLRYFAGVSLTRGGWPWGTLFVNLVGSLLVAIVMFGALKWGFVGEDARVFLVTGVLGGFTTMSSFAYETVAFVDDAQAARAVGYVALTLVGCLGMAFVGRSIVQALPG